MSEEVLRFINCWVYDVGRALHRRLESLKDDLASGEEQIRKQASDEAAEILDWLYAPLPPLSPEEQLEKLTAIATDGKLLPQERLAAARRAARSTGRRSGRPRNETAQQAIQALTLHYATPLSWREIALHLRGCKHKRPNPERSCVPCGEAIRNAANRLEKFLQGIGFDLDFPKAMELDSDSRSQLMQIWQVEKKNAAGPL